MKISIFTKIIISILILATAYYFLNKNFGFQYFSSSDNGEEIIKNNSRNKLNLLFVGDVMFDRYIRKKINEYSSPTSFVKNFLNNLSEENQKYDYVVANLEGPITENKSKTLNDDGTFGKELLFTFPANSGEILNLLNIKVVSLANNHTDNFYYEGFQSTIKFLDKGNIKYFGNPYNSQKDKLSEIICEKNICIGYVAYNQFTSQNNPQIIVDEINKLKLDNKTDFVVVFPHFGEEYETISNQTQKSYAKKWIDAGADLVIGAHPHVIQENEIYKDKYIYYSVGNYIFDQWFEENVKNAIAVNFKFIKDDKGNKNIEKVKEIKIRTEKEDIKYLYN